jgi:hypothetical protein
VKPGLVSNDSDFLATCNQSIAEPSLLDAGTIGHDPARSLLPFQFQADPWHENEITRAGLDGAGAGKEEVREGVTDCSKPQFVARFIVAELVDEVHHLTTFVL